MYIVTFSYEREVMLRGLVNELKGTGLNILIIDDGSEFTKESLCVLKIERHQTIDFVRTRHEGKRGFWKKWLIAQQIALGTDEEYFLFLPDDFQEINMNEIEAITKQGWENQLMAINISNEGDRYRWGKYSIGQSDIKIGNTRYQECAYVDGAFLTNRKTLESIEVNPVPDSWFNYPDKSSGVGYMLTMQLRALGCPMMRPIKSLAYHGDHDSVMHYEHRKKNPLISK